MAHSPTERPRTPPRRLNLEKLPSLVTAPDALAFPPHVIIPVAVHVEPPQGRIEGLAPMPACTAWVPPADSGHLPQLIELWICERETEVALAMAILHAQRFISESMGAGTAVTSVTATDAVWRTMTRRVVEASASFRNPNGLGAWNGVNDLHASQKVMPRTATSQEAGCIRMLRERVKLMRQDISKDHAKNRQHYTLPGIVQAVSVPAPEEILRALNSA